MKDIIINLEKDGVEIARGSLHNIDRILYEHREGYTQGEGGKTREDVTCSLLGISPTLSPAEIESLWNTVQHKKQQLFQNALANAEETSEGTFVPKVAESATVAIRGTPPAPKSDPMSVTREEAVNLRKIAYMVAYITADLNPEWGDYVELQGGIDPEVIEDRRRLRRRR